MGFWMISEDIGYACILIPVYFSGACEATSRTLIPAPGTFEALVEGPPLLVSLNGSGASGTDGGTPVPTNLLLAVLLDFGPVVVFPIPVRLAPQEAQLWKGELPTS
jgi:hypothetical protein